MSRRLPALVAFDIDGTLLDSRGELAPGTRACLDAARGLGVRIMLASGRPVAGLRHQMHRLAIPVDGVVLVGSNGAQVEDAASGEVLDRARLAPASALPVYRVVRDLPLIAMVPDEGLLVVEDALLPIIDHEVAANGLRLEVVDDLAVARPDPPKILVAGVPDVLARWAPTVAAAVPEAETCFSAPIYFEVNAPGVTKGRALLRQCARLGIDPADTIAFGDHGNDIAMLRAAGTGVAMGNAIPAAKAAADVVTADNDHEGIAAVLAPMFGLARV